MLDTSAGDGEQSYYKLRQYDQQQPGLSPGDVLQLDQLVWSRGQQAGVLQPGLHQPHREQLILVPGDPAPTLLVSLFQNEL